MRTSPQWRYLTGAPREWGSLLSTWTNHSCWCKFSLVFESCIKLPCYPRVRHTSRGIFDHRLQEHLPRINVRCSPKHLCSGLGSGEYSWYMIWCMMTSPLLTYYPGDLAGLGHNACRFHQSKPSKGTRQFSIRITRVSFIITLRKAHRMHDNCGRIHDQLLISRLQVSSIDGDLYRLWLLFNIWWEGSMDMLLVDTAHVLNNVAPLWDPWRPLAMLSWTRHWILLLHKKRCLPKLG